MSFSSLQTGTLINCTILIKMITSGVNSHHEKIKQQQFYIFIYKQQFYSYIINVNNHIIIIINFGIIHILINIILNVGKIIYVCIRQIVNKMQIF